MTYQGRTVQEDGALDLLTLKPAISHRLPFLLEATFPKNRPEMNMNIFVNGATRTSVATSKMPQAFYASQNIGI